MTLLLGPPGAGKTTLLLALAGKLDKDLNVSGNITYCGHQLSEFIPQRTCTYISPNNLHTGEMPVRETLNFSGRCLGVGPRYRLLSEILKKEKEAENSFMNTTTLSGTETNLITDYVLKILGLETCADTIVGDQMRRGISGGEKKRVTTGEMLVGPANVFFMDEISTGLDSSTTFRITKFLKQMVHVMDLTMVISLLQPDPETYKLFDDIILMSEGQIVYQGPCENVLEFFELMGFKCPERKGVADFLQEMTSRKDQEQYWFKEDQSYTYITISEFARAFKSFHIGHELDKEIQIPYDKSKTHPDALVKEKYGISNLQLLKACFEREWLLSKRNSVLYIFKTFQLTFMSLASIAMFFRTRMHTGTLEDGGKFFGALFFGLLIVMFNGMAELTLTVIRLPVFYKQRDSMLYPAWAFALPIWVLRIPLSLMESGIWVVLTYYTIGFAPDATRFGQQFLAFFAIHQMALSLFRLIAAVGRTEVLSNSLGALILFLVVTLGGFVVAKDDSEAWISWGFYVSPMMYAQNALVLNEFLDKRWSALGKAFSNHEAFLPRTIRSGFVLGPSLAVSRSALGDVKRAIREENDIKNSNNGSRKEVFEGIELAVRSTSGRESSTAVERRGMVLPFQPLSLAFNHVDYYIDTPFEMKHSGFKENRLQLLKDVSGAFRPGILTALVGVSGAGKTTLIDVLAGYPKNQSTFARVSGYCEQNDIHSPNVTVYESLLYSAWLRLSADVNAKTRKIFVDELMELVELHQLRNAMVGLPGIDGLTIEQRKRLTIAVELVTNPSIIFMDEPTSGLDARAAAIVMRTVRNTVDTGRTVLLLMKIGGQIIYAGPLGLQSQRLVEYFQAIPGVPKITNGYNPATWVLEDNQELIRELSFPSNGSKDLLFQNKQQLQNLLDMSGTLYAVVIFLGSLNTSAVQPIVSVESTVFYREKAAGMYSSLPYALSQQIPIWCRWYYWANPLTGASTVS
ncbi:plant PDR ABC transporter associated [Artemisia annua]|uniref:Plant PDR ABC transporter associated n=1 Tax=Artemisia annua TaxID=35608 RepID=A0A2U1L0E9_ARTAN|nr:plant PDR ABC transporter associated [Artemisia annua]